MEVIRIKKILVRNWPIGICLHCVRTLSWFIPTMSTLPVVCCANKGLWSFMYSFCLPNLLKECWRLRLNFCTVDKFPLLLRSVAIDEPGFCWLFPFPPCMRTTSPPENERNFHEDIQKSCQMTTSSNANCHLTRKLPDGNTAEILLSTLDETEPLPGVKIGGNYGNIYVKWVNPELHIVIWRKKKPHIHC